MALLLVIVSVPQFLASLIWVPGAQIARHLPVNPEEQEVDMIIESANASLFFAENPAMRYALSSAIVKKSNLLIGSDAVNELRRAAFEQALESVHGHPANPFYLEFLANLSAADPDSSPEMTLFYMDASISVAGYEPFLFDNRLRLGMNLYNFMTPEQREIFTQQLVWAFDQDRSRFITMPMTLENLHLFIKMLEPWPEKQKWLAANRH